MFGKVAYSWCLFFPSRSLFLVLRLIPELCSQAHIHPLSIFSIYVVLS